MTTGTTLSAQARTKFLSGASLAIFVAFAAPGAAFAQDKTPRPTAAPEPATSANTPRAPVDAGDIIVTGSRVVRDGYQAPTPVTVLGKDTLDAMGKTNIADALNQLPQLSQSVTPSAQPAGLSGGAVGVNQLNLRSLGSNRTLVLQDGKRMINSSLSTNFAAPDVNTIPNSLVSRVDTVTGGASAAYGSDALTGVVNFILDHKFTGLKGTVQGGVTTYGDDRQYLISLTAGTAFGPEGRGHLLLSGELASNDGIVGNTRPWNRNNASVITNPAWTATNGQPFYLVARQIGVNNGTLGGLITSGPLRGIYFGQNGQPAQFNYGLVSGNNAMSGGDWQYSRLDKYVSINPSLNRKNIFGRASYDLTESLNIYGELQWARADATNSAVPNFMLGNGVTVRADNAFIPAAIASQLPGLGLTSLTLGTTNGDVGLTTADNRRTLTRWNVGASGDLGILGGSWHWDAYYQDSSYDITSRVRGSIIKANFALAVDAVRNPATGAIVCRSTLTNPTNGCVPYNVFGTGVNSEAAINYITGISSIDQTLKQRVAAASMRGEPFSTWAGPVSLAFGIEHRRESVSGQATATDDINGFTFGNFHPTFGSYNVTEGFLEAVVPLAKDASWAKSLDLNGAVRGTDYSTSGYVTTWKAGAIYAPVDDLRFRVTRSRDIRAPNLGELFAGGQTSAGIPLTDPFTNTQTSTSFALSSGNPNLKPEVADTTELGVVFTPSFIPGFQASVDYFKIDIAGAVQIPNAQTIVNLCFQGNTALCSNIQRTNGAISLVVTSPSNVLSQSIRGLDFEASYRFALSDLISSWNGSLSVRALGTYVSSLKTANTNGTIVDGAGVLGGRFGAFGSQVSQGLSTPSFVSTVFLNYDSESISAQLTMRYVGSGHYNNDFISCSSSCPAGSQLTINDNHIPSNTIFGLSVTAKPFENKANNLFLVVDNIFNKAPPVIGGNTVNTYYLGQANSDYYDRFGRTFRAGIRFKL
jgi:iron complex outermembrane receptor protein